MKLASNAFWTFAGLVATSIVAIVFLNPNTSSLNFSFKLLLIFGGIAAWAASSATALRKGKGITRSFVLLILLSFVVCIGVVRYGTFQPSEYHPVLAALRIACGFSIVLLWIVLVRAVTEQYKGASDSLEEKEGTDHVDTVLRRKPEKGSE